VHIKIKSQTQGLALYFDVWLYDHARTYFTKHGG
jgi:hypothetical protein